MIGQQVPWTRATSVCEQITPPEKKAGESIGFESTESGAGEQFLLLDYMAKGRATGESFFRDAGMSTLAVVSGCRPRGLGEQARLERLLALREGLSV